MNHPGWCRISPTGVVQVSCPSGRGHAAAPDQDATGTGTVLVAVGRGLDGNGAGEDFAGARPGDAVRPLPPYPPPTPDPPPAAAPVPLAPPAFGTSAADPAVGVVVAPPVPEGDGSPTATWLILLGPCESCAILAKTTPVDTMTSAVAAPLAMTTGCRRMGRNTLCLPR
jgi:hypothetical protein